MQTYALTTLARLKTALNISGSSDDTYLETLIDACTEFVEGYCHRRFKLTTYTNEIYDGTGKDILVLKQYPVDSSASFTLGVRSTSDNNDDWDNRDAESFHIDYAAGIITSMSGLFTGYPRHYRATYTAGYDFSNVTAPLVTLESVGLGDLELAVWELCKKVFNNRKTSSDVQSESIGDYSVTFRQSAMLDPMVAAILQKYVRYDGGF